MGAEAVGRYEPFWWAMGLLGLAGAAGWALALGGWPWLGAAAVLAGAGGGVTAARRRTGPEGGRGLRDLLASEDPADRRLADEIRLLMRRVDGHGEAIREVVRGVQEHATLLAWVVDTQKRATSDADRSLDALQEAVGRVAEHAGSVLQASQQGLEFMGAVGTSTEGLFDSSETLSRAAEDATSSVVQIHGALSSVQQGVGLLSEASDRSTEFIAQVGQAMGGIRERIDQSLQVAQKVETYARNGREVVVAVGEGVERIQISSQGLVQWVRALGEQSREIEGILGMITDVADETGLLSLNAAILAAQAGERGAAFGVVADQIRSLARRTRESTKHIEGLIRGIQANISEANLGLADNLEAVEEGREKGREAVRQLELIEAAVGDSVEQARQIAGAAQDQDEKSRAMVDSAGEVNESLHQVAENLGQSILEMDRIQALVQSLAALSQSVRAAADEHRDTGWKTSELMGSLATQVEGIQSLIEQQREVAADLKTAYAQVGETSESTGESLNTLHSFVNDLVERADSLRADVDGGRMDREEHGA